jgi:hypothetical protein
VTPTATQDVALTHDTPLRLFHPVLGLGLGTTDQTEPFQDSVKVVAWTPVPTTIESLPTAMQKVVLSHDTL